MVIETRSPEETFETGRKLGETAVPGQVFTLMGDLGVGKTVFTQGLARGLEITEPVSSPTFTIVQVYEEGRLPFYHFDVYRIGDVEEMDEVGFDDYIMGDGVSLIEWADLIEEILPEKRTEVRIEKDLEVGPGRGVGEMGRGGAGQVSPGRRAHDPQFLDVPLGGVLAHDPQGLLGVAQGHLVVPVGHPIAQHGVGDAHPVHPVRHHRPLVLHRQAPIAATRAGDDCQPVPMLGGKDGQGRFRHVERAALRLRSHLVVVGGAVWP